MNVALDKIDGRRGTRRNGVNGAVVDDYGFPDQPMLDEMTDKALAVLSRKPKGFVLMVEGASIDKQAHAMDTERWMLDTIEFDRAIARVRAFAEARGDTLVIITADHECSGAALIGGSRVSDAKLVELARANVAPRAAPGVASDASGAASAPMAKPADPKASLRDQVVGVYEQAGFPAYRIAADGYPETTDIDFRLLVGYGANADRYEDWRTNARPLQDGQQPFVKREPLSTYPATPLDRDRDGNFLVTGQVPGESAVHTATDVPLSAFGPGAFSFTGVLDNTDVFFKLAQAAVKGVVWPAGLKAAGVGGKR
jgi:alkaline phosphatase